MMKKYLAIGIVMLIGLASCEKDHPTKVLPPELEGTWIWHYSSGGLLGTTTYPPTTAYHASIVINNSVMTRYENDELIDTRHFEIERRPSSFSLQDSVDVMLFDDGQVGLVTTLTYQTLLLSEECDDCYQHYYEKP